jgi:hypothetical protein
MPKWKPSSQQQERGRGIGRYREALEFYADQRMYCDWNLVPGHSASSMEMDNGQTARKAISSFLGTPKELRPPVQQVATSKD